jgi:hypothetical protein
MPVSHVNRRRDTYYLHAGTTKTGKPRYWFSRSDEGEVVEAIPDGYEVHENPEAQVFLRRKRPQVVSPFEVALVEKGLQQYAPGQNCIVDVQGEHIVVYHAERISLDLDGFGFRELPAHYRNYLKVMRFTLEVEAKRTFRVQRWCFRGSIDRWIDLYLAGSGGTLSALVEKFCPHIGKESFYELM